MPLHLFMFIARLRECVGLSNEQLKVILLFTIELDFLVMCHINANKSFECESNRLEMLQVGSHESMPHSLNTD